jgi:hypothetical protein
MSARIPARRRHLEEMRLALAEGLSIDAARERLSSYRDHLPRLAMPSAPAAALAAQPAPCVAAGAADDDEADERRLQWWQRD